jgi:hypothetical protein
MKANRSSTLARITRRIVAVFAEIRYAQRRLDAIRTNPDSYLVDAEKAPESYGEFLFRTSGVLLHEPTADRRERGGGRLVS